MATQSPPQPAASPAFAIPTQANAPYKSRPASDPNGANHGGVARNGAAQGGSDARLADAVNSTTQIVASGNSRSKDTSVENEINSTAGSGLMRLPAAVERLPVGIAVSIPIRDFRVRNLLAIAPDQFIETQWSHGEDLPLSSGAVQLSWIEFEVVDSKLAVRITRLA
jgi:flagellar motor switch protein FliN/FliY